MHGLKRVIQELRLLAFIVLTGLAGQGALAQTTPATPPPPAPAVAGPPVAAPAETAPAPATPVAPTPDAMPAPDPAPDGDASNAAPVDVEARPVALIRGNSSWDDGFKNLNAAFKKIQTEITKSGLKAVGRPITAFVETDDNGFHYEAMVPLEKAPEGKEALTPEVRLGQSPSGKAMKFQHRGAYDDIDSTYEAITAYMDEKGLEARNLFFEEYLNDMKTPDDAGTQIDIYVFLK